MAPALVASARRAVHQLCVQGGSTLLMGANGVVEVIHSIRAGESQGFRPLCEEESPS